MIKSLRIHIKIFINSIARKRHQYLSDKNFLIIAAIWVGTIVGLAAVVLKAFVNKIKNLLDSGFNIQYENYLYLLTPLIGIVLSVVIVRLLLHKHKFYKGLSSIIYSISRNNANVEKHNTYSHIITSGLTVGLGGSVGLEAPIAVTGAAIGSNTAKDLLMGRQHRTLLLASGVAAGIAAMFNSPIAGVIFAFEVILTGATLPAFIPLLISSATGAVVAKLFDSHHGFYITPTEWNMEAIPLFMLLGAMCGIISPYMIKTSVGIEHILNKLKKPYYKAIVGGLAIGLLLFLFPPLYGEGYGVINYLMEGSYESLLDRSLFYQYKNNTWFLIAFATAIVFLKVVASSVTIGSGGNGGIFGPSLFTGALVGFVFAQLINQTGLFTANTTNFIALAMGGVISGVLHAPLTGIFLIAEITGGYTLFIPLMMVSAMSYFITRYFEPNSIYTKTLIERGMIASDRDHQVLAQMDLNEAIENDFNRFLPNQSLNEVVNTISACKHNIFPVVEADGTFAGVVLMDEIRDIIFKPELHSTKTVEQIMIIPPTTINTSVTMDRVFDLFEMHNVWYLPVVDNHNMFLGMVSKSGVLMRYRKQLIEYEKQSQHSFT
jgi:CIC family chloride channel protein